MYVPAHFEATDQDLAELLSGAHVVDLISPVSGGGLIATPLPMLYEPGAPSTDDPGVLLGHVARNNPHWHAAGPGESLVIAHGPDAYVSPRWYPSTAEHGRNVPTWNYLTAHVYGELVVHDDVAWLRDLVTRLTNVHEATIAEPWHVEQAPASYIEGQLRAIVGVELRISRIEAKAKLGQNRPEVDQLGVIEALSGTPIAQAMREHPAG